MKKNDIYKDMDKENKTKKSTTKNKTTCASSKNIKLEKTTDNKISTNNKEESKKVPKKNASKKVEPTKTTKSAVKKDTTKNVDSSENKKTNSKVKRTTTSNKTKKTTEKDTKQEEIVKIEDKPKTTKKKNNKVVEEQKEKTSKAKKKAKSTKKAELEEKIVEKKVSIESNIPSKKEKKRARKEEKKAKKEAKKEEKKLKKKNKEKKKLTSEQKNKIIKRVIIILICALIVGFASYNIYRWYESGKKTQEQIDKIKEIVEVVEKEDNENTEIIKQEQEINLDNPYWDFINMNLIDVDFSKLKQINNQTKGWIKVSGTNVNYPFVQTDNNDFYLFHSFDQSYNDAGWVFMDYRNNTETMDKNTVLYAHGRLDNTMFGSLRHILDNGWLNNSENFVIMLSTDYENTLWQVFSAYIIPTTNDYIRTEFTSNDQFLNFANILKDRSQYNFNTPVYGEDKILTLSTCYDDYSKMVIHAKLIKKEAKK